METFLHSNRAHTRKNYTKNTNNQSGFNIFMNICIIRFKIEISLYRLRRHFDSTQIFGQRFELIIMLTTELSPFVRNQAIKVKKYTTQISSV